MKSKVDFIVATELNSDTNYYSDIAGSWVRDIHSFFIQVNTSEYGDSRIMKPSKSVEKNMVVVKGGKNSTILIDDLDIDSLENSNCLVMLVKMPRVFLRILHHVSVKRM